MYKKVVPKVIDKVVEKIGKKKCSQNEGESNRRIDENVIKKLVQKIE